MPDRVAVGFCHGSQVHAEWRTSYARVRERERARVVTEIDIMASGAHIGKARCAIVATFLESGADAEWLWMVDTDATFGDDVLDRLLASADPVDRPIVGALAFSVNPPSITNCVGGGWPVLIPTLFVMDENGVSYRLWDYPRDQVVEVDGTGCHCMLIHRSVFTDAGWDDGHPLPWFRPGTVLSSGGSELSEDLFFCYKARSLGYAVHVDTSVKTGHVKTFVADEDIYLAQIAANGAPRHG